MCFVILAIILIIGVIFGLSGAIDFVGDALLGLFILGFVIPLVVWIIYVVIKAVRGDD